MLKEINRYIENNDMIGLRYIFLDCLDVDPTFEKYKEGYDKVKTIDGFFEDYVEIHPLIEEKEKWNEDYWIQLKNDLRENFSEKRFIHMREVAKVYFSDKIIKLQQQRVEEKKLERRIEEQRQKNTEWEEKNKGVVCLNEDKPSVEEEQQRRLEKRRKELEAKNEETERHIKDQKRKVENDKKEYAGTQSKKGKEIALVLGIAIIMIITIITVLKMA